LDERQCVLSPNTHLEVESIDSVMLTTGHQHFYLCCEDQRIEFTFHSYSFSQMPYDGPLKLTSMKVGL
jgi:hypothetical protein